VAEAALAHAVPNLRHQLLTAADLPPADAALQASALRAFEAFIDECTRTSSFDWKLTTLLGSKKINL
jgi:hypothetical protein